MSRDSVLDAVFGGVEHQLVKCSVCGDDSVKMTPVRTIHLSLPSEASVTCELEAALRSNMQGVGGCSEGVRACVRVCACVCVCCAAIARGGAKPIVHPLPRLTSSPA